MIFIAEIGINHNGKVEEAKKLIDMVCNACERAGVETSQVVVKFQKRDVDKAVPEEQKNKEKIVPWRKEPTTYYQYKKDIEFGLKEFNEIDSYCTSKKIKWATSVWDIDSAIFINENFLVPFVKIPSAKIVDEKLLQYCNENFSNVIISTGMSSPTEIQKAVKILNNCNLTILHCNSSYPAKDDELNLNCIIGLKEDYQEHVIGYSGHEEGISACIVAKTLGAEVIERHITLSRSNWGTDQAASIVYDQLWRLLRDLNKVNMWCGDGIKKIYESELPIKKKLRG